MIQSILALFSRGVVGNITTALGDAYKARLRADTDEKKLEADMTISQLSAQRAVLVAEQRNWYTAWIRPALALPVVLYVWKIIVWDTILGWGVTPNPGEFVNWIVVTVVACYFLTRPFEKK